MAEALARELVRVTEIREHYRQAGKLPGTDVTFAVRFIDVALEFACAASGRGDVREIIAAHAALKEIHE